MIFNNENKYMEYGSSEVRIIYLNHNKEQIVDVFEAQSGVDGQAEHWDEISIFIHKDFVCVNIISFLNNPTTKLRSHSEETHWYNSKNVLKMECPDGTRVEYQI